MMIFQDNRYGKDGRAIWLITPGPIIYIPAIIFVVSVISGTDWSHINYPFLITSGLVLIGIIYLQIANIQSVLSAINTLQRIEVDDWIRVRLFFGREFVLSEESIVKIATVKPNKWLTIATILSFDNENYQVTTACNKRFFVSGKMKGSDQLAKYLADKCSAEN